MKASPQRKNFPKAAFSSPLSVNSALAGHSSGASSPSSNRRPVPRRPDSWNPGDSAKTRPNVPTAPTHSAFAQSDPRPGGSPFPSDILRVDWEPSTKASPRQGALYGAIEALQAATRIISEAENTFANGGTPQDAQVGPVSLHAGSTAGLTPEEIWQRIPAGGESSWKTPQPRQSARLCVARLQESLSEAASGLQMAQDACLGSPGDALGTGGLSSPATATALQHECAALEAESKELAEEKLFLDARLKELQQQLARTKNDQRSKANRKQGTSDGGASPGKNGPASFGDVSEMAVVLRLLACLKDVALKNRSLILPADDPAKWTREQQVVAYFLDEVEASQARIDGGY